MKPVLSAAISRSVALVALATFAFTFPAQVAFAQAGPTMKSFEGVWRITKVVTAGVADAHPQPSLQIFSRGYYSLIRVTGSEARQPSPVPKDPSKLTDEEKIARYNEWAPFGASAGTYEVKGNTLITHAIVAKNAGGMTVGATEEATIQRIDGDTFVATPPPGQPNSGRQTTYTRVP